MLNRYKRKYKELEGRAIEKANNKFNRLSHPVKRWLVILFGIASAVTCLGTIGGLFSSETSDLLRGQSITGPTNINPMKENLKSESLIPLGKMKGEVDGEFDSFYVAVDKDARLFINRNISYGENAYEKGDAWKEITMNELKQYERSLHFIPLAQKSKGLKP
jgi:hypothetical protein